MDLKHICFLVFVVALLLFVVQTAADGKSKHDNYLKRKAKAFIESKAKMEGNIQTESGLVYRVISRGTGSKSPTLTSTVETHYRGTLIDGSEFDSSYARNKPATFGVSQVIKGWTEALQLMHEGDKFELYIPWELAYGERGSGQKIPPFSPLIFEIELLKIKDKQEL